MQMMNTPSTGLVQIVVLEPNLSVWAPVLYD